MRWLNNFIGNFRRFANCSSCQDSFSWKKWQDIDYDKTGSSMFPICKECFNKLPVNEIIFWCEDLLNRWVSSTPIDYTEEKIKKIREQLKESINRLKSKTKNRRNKMNKYGICPKCYGEKYITVDGTITDYLIKQCPDCKGTGLENIRT